MDKERKALEQPERGPEKTESESESSDSSEEEEDIGVSLAHANIDAITKTPRATTFKLPDFLIINYEKGMDRIEMPWRTEQKVRDKKEAPVAKVRDKRNYKGINESQEVAVNIIRTSLKMQSEILKEKL